MNLDSLLVVKATPIDLPFQCMVGLWLPWQSCRKLLQVTALIFVQAAPDFQCEECTVHAMPEFPLCRYVTTLSWEIQLTYLTQGRSENRFPAQSVQSQTGFFHSSPSEKLVYIVQTAFRGGKREQSVIHATALVWLEEMFLNPYNCF